MPICLFLLTLSGCLKSDLSKCPNFTEVSIVVEAVDMQGMPLVDEVDEVVLYLFSTESGFIKRIDTKLGERNKIDNLEKDSYTIVAWGNAQGEGMVLPEEQLGKSKNEFFMSTKSVASRAEQSAVKAPLSDLFWGRERFTMPANVGEDEITVKIQRVVGAATVKVLGVSRTVESKDFNITFSEAYNRMDFGANHLGDKVVYKPEGYFKGPREFVVDKYMMPAADSPIRVNLYQAGKLLHTITQMDNGAPLIIERGKVLNIIIDLSAGEPGEITVTGELQSWNEKVIDKGRKKK